MHTSQCIRCDRVDGFPCLVNGKADAQTVCVDPALAHDNLELVTNAKVERLETDASGRQVTVGRHDHGRRFGSALLGRCCGRVVRGAELVAPAAPLRERRASTWAGEPLRPGRPQLHAPQQRRVDGAVERAQPDQLPEDARDERLVPEGRGLGVPVGRHPDARQVGRRAAPGEDTAVPRVGQRSRAREQLSR